MVRTDTCIPLMNRTRSFDKEPCLPACFWRSLTFWWWFFVKFNGRVRILAGRVGGGGVFAITDFSDLLIFFVHWTVRAESVESPALQLTVVPYSDHNLFFYPEKVKKTGEKKRTVSSAKKKPAGEKEKAKGKLTPEKKTPPLAKSRGERRAERNEFGAPVGWRDLDSVRINGPLLKQRAKNEPQVGFFCCKQPDIRFGRIPFYFIIFFNNQKYSWRKSTFIFFLSS